MGLKSLLRHTRGTNAIRKVHLVEDSGDHQLVEAEYNTAAPN